ncbi:hypothetical protein NEOLEDRAFT_1137982 [Neolentinus lepideus HHB14362 ss-1]|uniref:Uncharacterized protein n=1 Tax=Neolentinus lepideus HHB14362 ss-1 TaxID=1314782 RepID=A0A165QJK6_9AGAM|nr:hypothetical protein NEOLEDRAFT_1137982 [Neolentinus lepideus HHB14362 ss-1]
MVIYINHASASIKVLPLEILDNILVLAVANSRRRPWTFLPLLDEDRAHMSAMVRGAEQEPEQESLE